MVYFDEEIGSPKNSENMVEEINWLPDWGKSRISSMMTDRPDWCVSRQRSWGVPLPLVIHKETGELHKDSLEIINRIAKKLNQKELKLGFLKTSKTF